MQKRNIQRVNLDEIDELDELPVGKLPEDIRVSIGNMELTIGDMLRWQLSKPVFRFSFTDGQLSIDIRIRTSLKKAILGGVFSILVIIAQFTLWYLSNFHGGSPAP